MPVDPLAKPAQYVPPASRNQGKNAPAHPTQRGQGNDPSQSYDRIDLSNEIREELEKFRQASDKSKFSLEGQNLKEAEFVLGQIADVGRGTLRTLNLSNCGLEEPIDISQLRGTNLKSLILRDNQTKEITGFEKVTELKIIDFSNTKESKATQAGEHIVDIAKYAGAKNLEGSVAVRSVDSSNQRNPYESGRTFGHLFSDVAGLFGKRRQ